MRYIFLVLSLSLIAHASFCQYSCGSAVSIASGYSTASNITTPGTNGIQDWVTSANVACGTATTSSGGFVNSDVYLFKYTTGASAGETFYFTISYNEAVDGPHSIGVWDNCSGTVLSGCKTSTYKFENVVGVCAQNLAANTTYYIGVSKEWASLDGEYLKFKVLDFTVELSNTQPNDNCSSAPTIGLSNSFTGSTRCNYTASVGSPSVCGMSIENDSWVKFIPSATSVVINYTVSGCTYNSGVQLSVFRGNCSSLTLVTGTCLNYAVNNSTGTYTLSGLTIGQTYYLRADGYAGDLCSYTYNAISGVSTPSGLPVEMKSFSANCNDGLTRLNWQTASEHNSQYFGIERSDDGYAWYEIGTVSAAGNSNSVVDYSFEDEERIWNKAYYRLKQVDQDGVAKIYGPVTSNCASSKEAWKLQPNPANGEWAIQLQSIDKNQTAVVSIFNETGSKIHEEQFDLLTGGTLMHVSIPQLSSGVYFVQLAIGSEESSIQKLIIL